MASEELPKLLTFVIRYNCLHLIEEMTCESEFDITVERDHHYLLDQRSDNLIHGVE